MPQKTAIENDGIAHDGRGIAKMVAGDRFYVGVIVQERREIFRIEGGIGGRAVNPGEAIRKFSFENPFHSCARVLENVVVDDHKTHLPGHYCYVDGHRSSIVCT
jgi:hypothetical protein